VLRFVGLAVGSLLGFAVVVSTVAATAFAVIGVGGHVLAQSGNSYATVISFDPSTIAARAPYFATIALGLLVLFSLIAWRLPARRGRPRCAGARGSHTTRRSAPGVVTNS
jgi:hypothetical protein